MAKTPEDLDALYRSLRSLLVEFETPLPGTVFEGRSASRHDFDLWSTRSAVVDGRPREEVFFAGIRRQKDCVGFYFFPVYSEPNLADHLPLGLRKLLKGKSCFQVSHLDGGLLEQIRAALGLGVESYQRRGWV